MHCNVVKNAVLLVLATTELYEVYVHVADATVLPVEQVQFDTDKTVNRVPQRARLGTFEISMLLSSDLCITAAAYPRENLLVPSKSASCLLTG